MDSRVALAPHRHARRLALAALVLATSGLVAARPSLQSVRLIVGDGATSVILAADGALPVPKVGVLTDPPRIYLDFPDVAAATEGVRVDGDELVRGVRVAVNQSRPMVTRVVIDLAGPAPHRIDARKRDAGQLTIVVGVPVAAAGAQPPPAEPPKAFVQAVVPAPAPAAAPAVPAAAQSPLPLPKTGEPAARLARSREVADVPAVTVVRAPAEDVARYLPRASPLLDRLERLRPLLVSLDAAAVVPEEQLKTAAEEFTSVREALTAIEPPRSVAVTHELFRDVCVLGAASATARVAPAGADESTRAWNAAAAAAGAIMLLDRARAELGLARRQPERTGEAEPVIAARSCARHAARIRA